MKGTKFVASFLGIVLLVAGCSGGTMIDKLVKAREKLVPVERPAKADPKLTLEKAYAMQKELVDRLIKDKKEKVIGYKLSPKTVDGQPVYGYLFESMILPSGVTLKKKNFIDLHLENEVVFVIGGEIDPESIKNPIDLKPHVKFVAPGVELPEIRYKGPIDDVTGLDLVVDNVVASGIIVGEGLPPAQVDADLVKVKMTRDGAVVNEGVATMVEGSPWNALFWLVAELGKKNERLKGGQIVFTGGIAKFMDSDPGDYEASYSGLGNMNFKVE